MKTEKRSLENTGAIKFKKIFNIYPNDDSDTAAKKIPEPFEDYKKMCALLEHEQIEDGSVELSRPQAKYRVRPKEPEIDIGPIVLGSH